MEFLRHYWPQITGVVGTSGVTFAIVFRDAFSKLMQDWTDERRAKRAARMASMGHDDRVWTKLVEMLSTSVADQKANGEALHALLERMVVATERSLDVQRMTSTQLSEMDKRMYRMEGALNSGGGIQ